MDIAKFSFTKRTKWSISSKTSLAKHLGVEISDIDDCLDLSDSLKYKPSINAPQKTGGKVRNTLNPHPKIRHIQKKIKEKLLESDTIIKWPPYIYGTVKKKTKKSPSRDYIAAAACHCQSKTIIKIDVENFYENIGYEEVYKIFNILYKYPKKISKILTDLTTYQGHVPQGALTSSHLASLVLFDIEPSIVRNLSFKKLTYTRYVDDITVSSTIHQYDMSWVLELIKNKLLEKNLFINKQKVQAASHSLNSVLIHGLRTNTKFPAANKIYVANVKAGIEDLKKFSSQANGITNVGYRLLHRKISGRISVLKRLNHPSAKRFKNTVSSIKPKASYYDVRLAKYSIENLFERHQFQKESHWFSENYYKTQYTNSIIKRNFPAYAEYNSFLLKILLPKR